ncbi:enolase 4 isoform X2 [Rhineura floridana]|uniref:enolase 4 isoform X2 n=1 Tax=Rhineura floridana TaxID=261503 RepID=UPI002AC83F80|nr:enolase 4 isoform X2 [Rhineura floridana]
MEYGENRSGAEQRQFTITDLKHQAAEYYRANEVPQRLEEVLNAMFYQRPEDFYGHLANYFSELSKPPVICTLFGKRVLDGIGRPTLEVEVSCRVRNCVKRICSSIISSHTEILENASPEAVDADEKERDESVNIAIEWINESLHEMLRGLLPTDQHNVDGLLGEYFAKKAEEDKERREAEKEKEKESQEAEFPISSSTTAPSGKKKSNKPGKKVSLPEKPVLPAEPTEPVVMGSMAIGCISLAVAKTAATLRDMPLYLHVALLKHNQELPKELAMPLPMTTVLSCGKSSPGKLNLMKEVMLIPPSWLTIKQGIERCVDIQKQMIKLLGQMANVPSSMGESKKSSSRDAAKKALPPVFKKMSHLGCLVTGTESLEQPLTLIQSACANLSLELGIDIHLGINCAAHELMDYDSQQWTSLCNTLGSKCYLIAEDSCRNLSKLLEEQNTPKCSGLIIKYTNEAKISDLLEMTRRLDGRKHISILGSPDGESSDDSLVDLAVGLGTRFIKLGGLSRGERVTKYNRLLAIEEELGKNGRLVEGDEHEFVDFTEEEEEVEEEELDYTDFAVRTEHPAM